MSVEVEVVREDDAWDGSGIEEIAEVSVRAALDHLGIAAGEVAILACDDARIARLNADHRDRAGATNVLSWPSAERAAATEGGSPAPPEEAELGDVAVAFETCAAEARTAGIALGDHLSHLLVHATLHLLGYDHVRDGDAALMERLEIEILGKMGLDDPYSR